MRVPAMRRVGAATCAQIFPKCCNNSTAGLDRRCYKIRSVRTEKVGTMSHATRLAILAAALTLAGSSAHAFTLNQGTTGTSGAPGGSNYGSTLTDPGSAIRNYSGPDLTTPKESTTTQPEGFSFRFGAGPMGSDTNRRLAPPAWSTDPLYFERDH